MREQRIETNNFGTLSNGMFGPFQTHAPNDHDRTSIPLIVIQSSKDAQKTQGKSPTGQSGISQGRDRRRPNDAHTRCFPSQRPTSLALALALLLGPRGHRRIGRLWRL
jgi:hypothetical protein